jgi:hypothetical protein
MLEHLGVAEENWRDGAKKYPSFIDSETPFYVGRAVAALAADPRVLKKSGRAFSSWSLADEYGFDDVDGRRPNVGVWAAENMPGMLKGIRESEARFCQMRSTFGADVKSA